MVSRCLIRGTLVGTTSGMIVSSYFAGATDKANRRDNPYCIGLAFAGLGTLLLGPPVGFCAGGFYFGMKRGLFYLNTCSKVTRLATGGIISVPFACLCAYQVANR